MSKVFACSRVSDGSSLQFKLCLGWVRWNRGLDVLNFLHVLVEPVLIWNSLHFVTPESILGGDLFGGDIEPLVEVWVSVEVSLPSSAQLVHAVVVIADEFAVKSMGLDCSQESSHSNHFHFFQYYYKDLHHFVFY